MFNAAQPNTQITDEMKKVALRQAIKRLSEDLLNNRMPWLSEIRQPLLQYLQKIVEEDELDTFLDSNNNKANPSSRWSHDVEPTGITLPRLPTPVKNADLAKLNSDLLENYRQRVQARMTYERKMQLKRDIVSKLLHVVPGVAGYVFGSSSTGLGFDSSDTDVSLMFAQCQDLRPAGVKELLEKIKISLEKSKFAEKCQIISSRVPILRFIATREQLSVDLNIGQEVGLRNTNLLMHYAKGDDRVSHLILTVKSWAQSHDLVGAEKGRFSSYSLTLMTIFFLQVCRPWVVPVLQQVHPMFFSRDKSLGQLKMGDHLPPWAVQNRCTPARLFIEFLSYYEVFDFSHYIISIRHGNCISRDVMSRPTNRRSMLFVEEPYTCENTCSAVTSPSELTRFIQACSSTLKQIDSTGTCTWLQKTKDTPEAEPQ